MKEKALLVVSFGTSYGETRKKTIEAMERDLQTAFPEYAWYHAWTSGRILQKVKKTEGLQIDNLEEALERIAADGIRNVRIQPTFMLNGKEHERALECIGKASHCFDEIRIGAPLLDREKDLECLAKLLPTAFAKVQEPDHLILMGHGTPGGDNSCYVRLTELLQKNGHENFHIGLVEGEPGIRDLVDQMEGKCTGRIYLAPFTIVAGDHAWKDMAGEDENCWQKILEREGYPVTCILQGMGELPEIRQMYVQHAKEAVKWC